MALLLRAMTVMLLALPVCIAASADDEPERPSIGLALGSGGAGGLAHIAMLEVFDDLEVKPDVIAGSSIGAVVGALYAAGLSAKEIGDIFDDFGGSNLDALSGLMDNDLRLWDLLRLDLNNGGLFDAQGFIDFIAGKVEARTFEDLEIPLLVVATDYWSGDAVILDEGDLFNAVKASMAVPGLFSPVQEGDRLLLDGGMANPLPFDVLYDRCDLIVAVDVTSTRSATDGDDPDVLDLLFSTFEIMQQSIISARMRSIEPDIVIRPDTSDIRLLHFNRIETILEKAAPAAEDLRQQLAEALSGGE